MSDRRDTWEGAFPFWRQQGSLREHWYPAALANELKPRQVTRQVVLGVPTMIWRGDGDELRAFLDICPHRQAQLSRGAVDGQGVTCPYHGWRFGLDGKCNHIPVTPDQTSCDSISLSPIPVCERGGALWVWMGQGAATELVDELAGCGRGWKTTRVKRVFPYDLDDVIENFMDFAHTAVVHPGLIRGISSAQERQVTIETSNNAVRAVHEPVMEKVGFLSGLVIPRGQPVQHADTFTVPGNVKVEYWFGDAAPKFVAFLGMTPIDEKRTLLLLTIAIDFGLLNGIIGLALPRLAKKVLDQDDSILSQQRENHDLLSNVSRRSLKADAVDVTVRRMRAHHRDTSLPEPTQGVREIRVIV